MEKDHTIILSKILNAYAPVGQIALELILESGSVEEVRKDEVVFHEKRYNAFEYFQLEGVSHRFNVDSDTQAVTTGIYQNEIVITPHFTRTTNGQSIFSLQALTDCSFLKVPAGTFRDISDQNQQIRMFGMAVIEKEFIRNLNFEVLFRSYTDAGRSRPRGLRLRRRGQAQPLDCDLPVQCGAAAIRALPLRGGW